MLEQASGGAQYRTRVEEREEPPSDTQLFYPTPPGREGSIRKGEAEGRAEGE